MYGKLHIFQPAYLRPPFRRRLITKFESPLNGETLLDKEENTVVGFKECQVSAPANKDLW